MARPGEERALRFVAMMLLLQRASYLVPAATDMARSVTPYPSGMVNVAMVTVAVTWNVGLAVVVGRRGWFPRWAVGVDVAVVCVLLAAGTVNSRPEDIFKHQNWPTKLALATAALLGAFLTPWLAIVVMLAPIAAHLGTTIVRLGTVLLPFNGLLGVVNSYMWWLIAACVMRRYLCWQGRALDETTRRQVEMEGRRAAERARYAERIAQYRRLHDTVLTTLTAIARGGLDHRTEAVRARCAAEADYVRRLIHEDSAGGRTPLGARLDGVITEVERLGLWVRYRQVALPARLPDEVVNGITEASREALNNVLAHSGTREAWLTATGDEEAVLVRIVDRGGGFDSDTLVPGFGIRSSIIERMRETGGNATVTGLPGSGACVELTWPSGQRG